MKLVELFSGNKLDKSIYAERYINDRKGRFEDYSEVDARYDPQGSEPYIDLPFTLLDANRCLILTSEPSNALLEWVHVGEKFRFFWHPDVSRNELDLVGSVRTQPTSSTRTLLTEGPYRVYIKTDLNKKHFRFVRRLQRSSVEHSIAVCRDLRDLCKESAIETFYGFLPESLGIILLGGEHEGSGVLYRETIPIPSTDDTRVLIPYHSLYATDENRKGDEPLLVQISKLHGQNRTLEYFVSAIVAPLLETWVRLVSKRGLLPELHGQNALIEIDSELKPRRLIHRDFQGTYSDSRIRRAAGLMLFAKHIAGSERGTTVESQYSNVFDGMLGRYLLSRMAKTFCAYFPYSYRNVCDAIKSYHRGIDDWNAVTFPRTTYRFGSSAKLQIGNEVTLMDTGEEPEFR